MQEARLYHKLVAETGRVFAQVKLSKLKQLPIRNIDFSKSGEKAHHDRMVALVNNMLNLNKKLHITNTEHERKIIQRQINVTNKHIDNLVYELYDLTEDEVAVVEESVV